MSDWSEPPLGPWIHRSLGDLSPEIVPFWEALTRHEFALATCTRCHRAYFPYTICNGHADIPEFETMEWRPSSGRGRLFAFTVVHKAVDAAYQGEVPYVLAMVELDEGPLFPSRLVGCPPDEARIGMRIQVRFVDSDEAGHTLPLFEPES